MSSSHVQQSGWVAAGNCPATPQSHPVPACPPAPPPLPTTAPTKQPKSQREKLQVLLNFITKNNFDTILTN